MKKMILTLSMSAACAIASAASGGEGGNTNCNGQGNPNSPCQGNGGSGGAGGTGGQGGNGLGVGVGVGIANAAAIAAANAAAAANSNATATGGNATATGGNARQGQAQGQQQGQQQSSRNRNTANGGTGGQATATGGNSGGNTMTTGNVTVEGDKGDTYVAPAQERNPVATAYAAPLVSTNGTCMGSSSAGGQGASIGLSFGTTWTDNNCDIRYDAEALRAAGLPDAARARLCQKAEIAKAMEAVGTPCQDLGAARRVSAILNGATVATTEVTPVPYQDPIIRARLGLPPLK